MQKNIARDLCQCSLLVILAVLFQSAPVFLPIAGLLLSPLSTLPLALAAIKSKSYGILSYIVAAIILLIIFPQESAILVFSTGLIGIFIGILYQKKIYLSILFTSAVLFLGINALTFVLHINVFGDLTPRSMPASAPVFLIFSVIYSAAWLFIIRFFVAFLTKVKVLKL